MIHLPLNNYSKNKREKRKIKRKEGKFLFKLSKTSKMILKLIGLLNHQY